jgi:YesN/AraC family two-component response regulator
MDYILVVDDDEDVRFFLQYLLEKKGYHTLCAENGKKALKVFEQNHCNLVISDIKMPEMDGLDLLKALKKHNFELPVVMTSAFQEAEYLIEALRLGACDFIPKPYNEQSILRCLKRVFHIKKEQALFQFSEIGLQRESQQFVFETNPDTINSIAYFLSRKLLIFNLNIDVHLTQVALIEALSNAMFHGNLEISSELNVKENLDCINVFFKLVEERLTQEPYKSRRVYIDYTLDDEKVSYVIRDEGKGFNSKKLYDPLTPENFYKSSGRGVLIIRSYSDEVFWNDVGNEITLIKYRSDKKV